jgi:TPR repeat protein
MSNRSINMAKAFAAAALFTVVGHASSAHAQETPHYERLLEAAAKTCRATSPLSTLACQLMFSIPKCKDGDASACEMVGYVTLAHPIHDIPKGLVARAFLLRACELSPSMCVDFARLSMDKLGESELAGQFLELGCTRSASVCRTAAVMYRRGREIPADAILFRHYMQRACKANDASACALLVER